MAPRRFHGFVLAVLVALVGAGQASGGTAPHSAGGTLVKQLPEGYDYLYRWDDDEWVRVDRRPLGTIRLRSPAASGIQSSDPAALEKTICLRIDSGPTRGRRCWREYGVGNEEDRPATTRCGGRPARRAPRRAHAS